MSRQVPRTRASSTVTLTPAHARGFYFFTIGAGIFQAVGLGFPRKCVAHVNVNPHKNCVKTHVRDSARFQTKTSVLREKKESVPICEALPPPTPSLPRRRKGFVCAVRAPLIEFINTHRPGAGEAWGGRLSPPAPGPAAASGDRVAVPGATGRRAPGRRRGRGCCAAEDQRAGPGRADLGGTLRARAGAQPPFVLRLRGRRGLRRLQLSRPAPSPRLQASPARTSSGPRAPPLTLPAVGLGAPELPAPRGRAPLVSPGGGSEGGGGGGGRGGGGGGRHVTLLATFHHSHQINNFSVPRPPPRRQSQPVSPPPPPHQIPLLVTRKLPSPTGMTESWTPSRKAKDQRGRRGGAGARGW